MVQHGCNSQGPAAVLGAFHDRVPLQNQGLATGSSFPYGLPHRGRLLAIEGVQHFGSRHTLAQNLGCRVDAMGESNWAWVGLLAGPHAAVQSDLAKLRLRTDQGWVAPAWYASFDFLEALP